MQVIYNYNTGRISMYINDPLNFRRRLGRYFILWRRLRKKDVQDFRAHNYTKYSSSQRQTVQTV